MPHRHEEELAQAQEQYQQWEYAWMDKFWNRNCSLRPTSGRATDSQGANGFELIFLCTIYCIKVKWEDLDRGFGLDNGIRWYNDRFFKQGWRYTDCGFACWTVHLKSSEPRFHLSIIHLNIPIIHSTKGMVTRGANVKIIRGSNQKIQDGGWGVRLRRKNVVQKITQEETRQ